MTQISPRGSDGIKFRKLLITILLLVATSNPASLAAFEQSNKKITQSSRGLVPINMSPHELSNFNRLREPLQHGSSSLDHSKFRSNHVDLLESVDVIPQHKPVESSSRWMTLNLNILSNLPVGDILRSIVSSGSGGPSMTSGDLNKHSTHVVRIPRMVAS